MDPQDRFDEKDASDERARIGEMKSDAMRMIEEMPPMVFEAWYNAAFAAMDEAATVRSSISTAALIDAPEDVFNEWMREDERGADAHGKTEVRRFQFAAATRRHEDDRLSDADRGEAAELSARRYVSGGEEFSHA